MSIAKQRAQSHEAKGYAWVGWSIAASVAAVALLAAAPTLASEMPAHAPSYVLDVHERIIDPEAPVECPDVPLVRYDGTHLRYLPIPRVHPAFAERLSRFEEVAREVAIEVYGRAPLRIRTLGTFKCRRIAAYPSYLSEHGLGNAIDVEGFDFGRLPRGTKTPEALPKALRGPFRVRMLDHWDGRRGASAVHSRFLKTLASRLIARDDIFRVLLGPAFPGHRNHFHFDCAPWKIVEVFRPEEP